MSTQARDPSVLEASKHLCKAVVRSLSFKRRQRATTGTQTVKVADTATEPMDAPQPMDIAPSVNPPVQPVRRVSFTMDVDASHQSFSLRRGDSMPALPPRASAVRQAVCQLNRRESTQESGRSSARISLEPPRASAVRAAMQPLYGDATPEPTVGLTKSPSQPELLVGVIKRASVGSAAARAGRAQSRRERRLARYMRTRESGFIASPPRASEVARAVDGLEM